MKVYTRKGDDGTTGLLFGGRVRKDAGRPEAYGNVDEAQAALGLARAHAERGGELDVLLVGIERDLWVLMAELATGPENFAKLTPGQNQVTAAMVDALEATIDDLSSRFEMPQEFVVPGEGLTAAHLDLARTVVRRAERSAVGLILPADSHALAYLNRLSDLVWVMARWQEGESLRSRRA